MNRLSGTHKAKSICHDCDLSTQTEMLEQGRCAHPEIRFVPVSHWSMNGEVEIVGITPSNKRNTPRQYRSVPYEAPPRG